MTMVNRPPLGLERLRISLDRLPVETPAFIRALPAPIVLPVGMRGQKSG